MEGSIVEAIINNTSCSEQVVLLVLILVFIASVFFAGLELGSRKRKDRGQCF